MRLLVLVLLLAGMCAGPVAAQSGPVSSTMTEAGPIGLFKVAGDLDHPWGMDFLPDGRMLVTERAGNLRIVTAEGDVSAPVAGTPVVYAQGQGGLLDVALDPDFASNSYVYLSYARPGPEGSAATAIGRGRMMGDSLEGFEVLFTQEPYVTGPNHFGSRIAFGPDGMLYLSTGERFQFEPAQDLSNHMGTIIRIARDGSVPPSNPFVGEAGAQPEIWSYGHRNVQSLAIHPETGELWQAEMGPLGGDELNRIERGRNYGWPVVSWGINYDGTTIPDPPTRPQFADAVYQWTPVISPSGMTFYTGSRYPQWTGDLLISSLTRQGVVRVDLDGRDVGNVEVMPFGMRIREVGAAPDGNVYVLSDGREGSILRMEIIE
jgi:glucose/arabinose dehydrogenase